jgi:hypothetical protein
LQQGAFYVDGEIIALPKAKWNNRDAHFPAVHVSENID